MSTMKKRRTGARARVHDQSRKSDETPAQPSLRAPPPGFYRHLWATLQGIEESEEIGEKSREDIDALCRRDARANARRHLARFDVIGGWPTTVRALEKTLHRLQKGNDPPLSDAAQFALRYCRDSKTFDNLDPHWGTSGLAEYETDGVLEFSQEQLLVFAEEAVKECFLEHPPSPRDYLPPGIPQDASENVSVFQEAMLKRGKKLLEILQDNPRSAYRTLIGGQGQSVPKEREHQHPSRQPGYEQPGREGKVIVKTYVLEEMRQEFRRVAKQARLTAEELLDYLVSSAVSRAATDTKFRQELAREGGRIKEIKGLAKEAARRATAEVRRRVTQKGNANRPASRRLLGKSTLKAS